MKRGGESIEKRSDEINSRLTPGHYEMDTVIYGHLSYIFDIKISIPSPSAGGTNSNESVSTLYVML